MYLSRDNGHRGLRSVEQEYKLSRIKAAMKLYQNPDSSTKTFRMFEEKRLRKSIHRWILTQAHKFAAEMGASLLTQKCNNQS